MPALFTATANTSYFVQQKLIGTDADTIPMVNVKPFGLCRLKPTPGGFLPCIPVLTKWQDTKDDMEVMGSKPLLNKSCIQCSIGGKIEFQSTGQIPMPHEVAAIFS